MTIHDFDDLRREPAVVVREWDDGNITRYPESHYLDFVVNGLSLLEVASVTNDASLITPLNEPVIHTVAERLGAFPYDELAHRGRRFLWPWQWGWRMPAQPPE